MLDTPEIVSNPNEIKGIIKPFQEHGINIVVSEGKINPILPEGKTLSPDQAKKVSTYFNNVYQELGGIRSDSALKISEALEKYKDNDAYRKDLIMYGPSLENDFAAQRIKRLETVRQEITNAQTNTQPGLERMQAIKAGTFARTHVADLGLLTTINFLRSIK
ncbi:hypothetical protein A2159_02870 [Candidatus Woesebacteria bacterium RBG_13_34_9]|uniref:Uncharacterized protein n=1 Tax=Candidatus Woesebacteria bacterium RBG_13_34_9 TaxID=1802477 RepID=A0A1F7X411_9BACT|nr:MAG: hypothetical protein A2159_02870 [Candidatus Woesebacteria bacterium RBG_13_34_9]